MSAVKIEIELPPDVNRALDADRAVIGHRRAEIIDAQLLRPSEKRRVDAVDGNILKINVGGGGGAVDLQLIKVVADAVDAEVGGDPAADAGKIGNVIGNPRRF